VITLNFEVRIKNIKDSKIRELKTNSYIGATIKHLNFLRLPALSHKASKFTYLPSVLSSLLLYQNNIPAAASCPPLLPVVSHLLASCYVPSCQAASTMHHLSSCRHPTCPSLTPHLHSHWLVVALHLIALPLPPVLLSTPLHLDALPPHVVPATPPLICLLFALTG
jgi:hypothetical protein